MKFNIFEAFAGIGSQRKALEILSKLVEDFEFEIVAISEWDCYANISYNAMKREKIEVKKSMEEKIDYLSKFTHSLSSKEAISIEKIVKKGEKFVTLLYESFVASNNLGSITEIKGNDLIKSNQSIDVITYSFPCQDLSTAGSLYHPSKGMGKGSGTRSSLLWEIERILRELEKLNKKPKFLVLENVINMLSNGHVENYKIWLKELSKFGYCTQTYVLSSEEFGIPQKRKRVIALSVLDGWKIDFVDTYLEREKSNLEIKNKIITDAKLLKKSYDKIDKFSKKELSEILKIDYKKRKYNEEAIRSIPNRTPSRQKMYTCNPLLFSESKIERKEHDCKIKKNHFAKNFASFSATITTKQDRHPNAGIISILDKNSIPNKLLKNLNWAYKMHYRFLYKYST